MKSDKKLIAIESPDALSQHSVVVSHKEKMNPGIQVLLLSLISAPNIVWGVNASAVVGVPANSPVGSVGMSDSPISAESILTTETLPNANSETSEETSTTTTKTTTVSISFSSTTNLRFIEHEGEESPNVKTVKHIDDFTEASVGQGEASGDQGPYL